MKYKSIIYIIITLAFALNLGLINAADPPNYEIASFSCSPGDTTESSAFSCTARVSNTGGTAGTITTAYLDESGDWLEESTYTQAGTSIDPGNSADIIFSGLRAKSPGYFGFTRIRLDTSEKTSSVSTYKVNVISPTLSASASASSLRKGQNFSITASVTAAGNMDVSLRFDTISGGCALASDETNPYSFSLSDGNSQSRTWNKITQGTSGNCVYTVTASASKNTASRSDSSSGSVTCSDCSSGSTDSTSSGGSGGGAGGASSKSLGELIGSQSVELASGSSVKFNISNEEHTLTANNVTETTAIITIQSEKQTFTLVVSQDKDIELNGDGKSDVNVLLKSIYILTKKANIVLTRLGDVTSGTGSKSAAGKEGNAGTGEETGTGSEVGKGLSAGAKNLVWIWILIVLVLVIAIIVAVVYFIKSRKPIKRR